MIERLIEPFQNFDFFIFSVQGIKPGCLAPLIKCPSNPLVRSKTSTSNETERVS